MQQTPSFDPNAQEGQAIRARIIDRGTQFVLDKNDGVFLTPSTLEPFFEAMYEVTKASKTTQTPNGPVLSAYLEPTVERGRAIGTDTGTHSLKFHSTRASGQKVLQVGDGDLMPFCDSKLAPFFKMFFKKFSYAGSNTSTSLALAASFGGVGAEDIITAAKRVYGHDFIQAFVDALRAPKTIDVLSGEIPIVFVPHPSSTEHTDLQITPISPVQSYNLSREIAKDFYKRSLENDDGTVYEVTRARFAELARTGSPQNISSMIGGKRSIIMAEFPDILDQHDASIFKHARGHGLLPALKHPLLASMAHTLIGLHRAIEAAGRAPKTVQAMKNTAQAMAAISAEHINDVFEACTTANPAYNPTHHNVNLDITSLLLRSVRFDAKKNPNHKQAFQQVLTSSIVRDAFALQQTEINNQAFALNGRQENTL